MTIILKIIFWLSLLFILYTYFGYPILLFFLTRFKVKPSKNLLFIPKVSMIITVYNEEEVIKDKLENAISLDYPKDKFEIIVVSDSSTDKTDDIVREFSSKEVKLIRMPERGGKAWALNAAVPKADGEIIVLSDARQLYDKKAILELVSNFSDPKVGAVSGELYLMNPQGDGVGEGVGLYWKYEKLMRKMESRLYSTSGATGAIYAIRKDLYRPIPDDTILDDVLIPMNIVLNGYRVIFEEEARAYDKVATTAKQELTRKIRTLSGNYQLLFRMHGLFNPFKNKVLFQFISHKVFRLLAPLALIIIFISNIFLLPLLFYKVIFFLQLFFYVCAILGHFMSKAKPSLICRFLGIPYAFVVLNYAALAGLYRYITKKHQVTWEKANNGEDEII